MSKKLIIKTLLLLLITPALWCMDDFDFDGHIADDPMGILEDAPEPERLETREEQLLANGSENDIKGLCLEAISNHNDELLRHIIAKASQLGMLTVIELLDHHHVPLNQAMPAPFIGCKPIHLAASTGQKKIANFLVQRGHNIVNEKATGPGEYCNQTPVHLAVSQEQVSFLDFLATNKADFCSAIEADEDHQPFRVGHYVEHFAAETGNTDLMAKLISYGADVNKKVATGTFKCATPLHIAILNYHPEMADFLLTQQAKSGAIIEAGNWQGMNALHIAAQLGHHRILETLLKHGAYPNERITAGTRENATALHLAASFGHLQCVLLLLNYGAAADWSASQRGSWDGFTPLVCAVVNDHLVVAQRLVWLGARLSRVGPKLQRTVASYAQKAEIREYLTQRAPASQDLVERLNQLQKHYTEWQKIERQLAKIEEKEEISVRKLVPSLQRLCINALARTAHLHETKTKLPSLKSLCIRVLARAHLQEIRTKLVTDLIRHAFKRNADANILKLGPQPIFDFLEPQQKRPVVDRNNVSIVFDFIGPYDKREKTLFDRVVHNFIKHGLNLNALDKSGYTPLARACELGNRWLVINLLARQADPKVGHNPIKAALLNGQSELVHTLCRLALCKKTN